MIFKLIVEFFKSIVYQSYIQDSVQKNEMEFLQYLWNKLIPHLENHMVKLR